MTNCFPLNHDKRLHISFCCVKKTQTDFLKGVERRLAMPSKLDTYKIVLIIKKCDDLRKCVIKIGYNIAESVIYNITFFFSL